MTKAILFGAKHTLKLKSVDVKITFFFQCTFSTLFISNVNNKIS